MSSKPNNLPSLTQNLRLHEKKMTMAEAVVMLADFFEICARKKRRDRTGCEYALNISVDYLKNALGNGKGTKKGTWTNLIQNAREIANSSWAHLDENEKIELEYIFSYIFSLNGSKGISGFGKDARPGQCKYCWRHTTIDGKGKWLACDKHSQGSRDPEIRKIMRFKREAHAIRARVHPYICVGFDSELVVSVDQKVCPHLAKLMGHVSRTPLEMYKLLDFDIGVKGVEIFELVWSMATYEAWHCAYAAGEMDIPTLAPASDLPEIDDELWARVNTPAPLAPNLLHSI